MARCAEISTIENERRTRPLEVVLDEIQSRMKIGFYGTITVQIVDGRIVSAQAVQNLRIDVVKQ